MLQSTGRCRAWSIFDWQLAALIILTGFIAAGFFFPDQLLVQDGSYGLHRFIALPLKIIGVVSLPIVVVIYALIKTKKIPTQNLALGSSGVAVALLLIYPPFTEYYVNRRQIALKPNFHSYLQLMPPAMAEKDRGTAGPAPTRIVFLGGSTTAWPDKQGRRWTEMVEERLKRGCPTCNVEVYNQGMDWYTSLHSLLNYETNIRQHRPDIVVVMHAINDLMHNADFNHLSNGPFRDDYGHYLGPLANLVQIKGPLQAVYKNFRTHWFAPPRRILELQTFPGLLPFRRNLSTLADLVELDGGKLVLMTEGYLYRPDLSREERAKLVMFNFEGYGADTHWSLATVLEGMRQYNQTIRETAGSRSAHLIDLEALIPKSTTYFSDDVHFTDRSYPLVADSIALSLLPLVEASSERSKGAVS